MRRLIFRIYDKLPHRAQHSIQKTIVAALPIPYRWGGHFISYYSWLKKTERSPLSYFEDYQQSRLRELLRHAYEHVPYYRKVFQERNLHPSDFTSIEDLQKLPILTKDIIRSNARDLVADNYPASKRLHGETSGSTGKPLEFFLDSKAIVREDAFTYQYLSWISNFSMKEPIAVLRTYVPKKGEPLWKWDKVRNWLFLSAYHLQPEHMDAYLQKIQENNIHVLRGYPSSIYVFAEYLRQKNVILPLKAVVTSSEAILPLHREVAEKQFQTKVYSSYGMNEQVVRASQCSTSEDYHISMQYGICEILDQETLAPATSGMVVGTSFQNFAMPLIRYAVGDVATRSTKSRCNCGLEGQFLESIDGRTDDLLSLPSGKVVPSINFYTLFHHFGKHIHSFQLHQTRRDHININIVPKQSYTKQIQDELERELRLRLDDQVEIEFQMCTEIPRDKNSGKIRSVISNEKVIFSK